MSEANLLAPTAVKRVSLTNIAVRKHESQARASYDAPAPAEFHGNRRLRVPLHAMGVGEHDAPAVVDDKARPARALLPTPLPRQAEVRRAVDGPDLVMRRALATALALARLTRSLSLAL